MTRMNLAVNATITVLGTLLIAAIGYGGMAAAQVHRTAAIHPVPKQSPEPSPPAIVPSPPTKAPTGPVVLDADLIDVSTAWMLVSDCPDRANPTCHNSVVQTADGGQTWSQPVQVGPAVAITDGDAPRSIRFLNRKDGFVFGHSSAFVTHDGGQSWAPIGIKAVFVASISMWGGTVWAATYPCPKGTPCAYEVRSSTDGGRTWSVPHRLPAGFSPEDATPIGSGVLLSAPVQPDIVLTTDRGVTWREIKSPCAQDTFRAYTTTSDGIELWSVCQGAINPAGPLTAVTLFVSENVGKTWTKRDFGEFVGARGQWLATPKPRVALSPIPGSTLITRDGGLTWSEALPNNMELTQVRFSAAGWGWAVDAARNLWVSIDAGDDWAEIGALPSRLS
jgi:hypothetical protein